jgi:succinylglutamate desuccinylase
MSTGMSGSGSDKNAEAANLSPAVQALAQADFGAVAGRFAAAGFAVAEPAPGILQIKSMGVMRQRAAVLVSVGVHGDETGPIEVLAHLLDALSLQPKALAVDLMVCVGNVAAIEAGKRFIDADLNRMFRPVRGALASAAEAARADEMIAATALFFDGAGPVRWHLDLHTAIRPSFYPTFAVVPDLIADAAKAALVDWLGQAAIGAVIMNPQSAGTYSYHTAEHHGAAGSTVELGRVGTLGQNDLRQFADVSLALDGLLRGSAPASAKAASHVFKVAQEIIKLSDDFRMSFDRSTQNFTALPAGALVASDGGTVYTVGEREELVVFPNPDVRVGLRAGLMVVRVA